MARISLTIEEALEVLEATPVRIAAATAGLTPAQLRSAEKRGEWSISDVLAHLRSCADARGEVIPVILAEDRPTLRAVDPRTLTTNTDYPDLAFADSFRAFRVQRARLLKVLNRLPHERWSRSAIVTGGGPARERNVLFYAQWLARHERPHVKQIERMAGARATAGRRGNRSPERRPASR